MRSSHKPAAILAIIMGLAGVCAPAAWAQSDGYPSERSPADRALEGARLDTIHLAMKDNYATLSEIVVVTPDCAFRADTSPTMRRNVNKVGITQDIPLIGEFFAATPRQGELNAGNQIGLAYADDSTLYIDLRTASAPLSTDRSLLSTLVSGPAGGPGTFAPGGGATPFAGFSVVNRDFQFQVPLGNFSALAPAGTACTKDAMTKLPPLAPYFAQPVGTAHLSRGQLIVLVKPSIIAGY